MADHRTGSETSPPAAGAPPHRPWRRGAAAAAALLAGLASPALAQDAPPAAVACTGCHGLFDGAPFPIQQLSADEIAGALAAFADGSREGTIMPRFAVAFSPEEARAIAEWFAAQGGSR